MSKTTKAMSVALILCCFLMVSGLGMAVSIMYYFFMHIAYLPPNSFVEGMGYVILFSIANTTFWILLAALALTLFP